MTDKTIRVMQTLSIALIWIFVIFIVQWIIGLIATAHQLSDALNASVAISIIAIPLFITIASILTYVFLGLRKHQPKDDQFYKEKPIE